MYSNTYDPTTGCCPTACPAKTGLDVQIDPPSCVYCDINAGLVYNPNNGSLAECLAALRNQGFAQRFRRADVRAFSKE